jgi:hypothetical protein
VDEEEDEVEEEEVNYIVSTNLKRLCRQFFDHEFFMKHPSPDPDNYKSFVTNFRKFAKIFRTQDAPEICIVLGVCRRYIFRGSSLGSLARQKIDT